MAKCAQCGNNYDQSFEIRMGGRTMVFDSFECAIAALAPTCPHCKCRVIGRYASACHCRWMRAPATIGRPHISLLAIRN
jgi:hypothetical protein